MNVFGVKFDSKLTLRKQAENSIRKANTALYALRLIKQFMNPQKMKTLLISNDYSTLHYNS